MELRLNTEDESEDYSEIYFIDVGYEELQKYQ
jgi:hypothetical protein